MSAHNPITRLWDWPTPRNVVLLVLVGLVAGLLSGMFGVGGGIVVIPALTMLLGYNPRLASGTALAAIVPLATVGVFSYAREGSISWIGALLLASGAFVGVQFGSWALARVSQGKLQIGFGFFMLGSAAMLFVSVPSRDAVIHLDWKVALVLVLAGLVTGVLAGLLGIGGGIVVVPFLVLVLGASDLVAKGTSLLMMIPSAAGGTVANHRRGNVDLAAAAMIGLPAATTTFLGARIAHSLSPRVASFFFAALIVVTAVRVIAAGWRRLRGARN